jgi:hypothetical protein
MVEFEGETHTALPKVHCARELTTTIMSRRVTQLELAAKLNHITLEDAVPISQEIQGRG